LSLTVKLVTCHDVDYRFWKTEYVTKSCKPTTLNNSQQSIQEKWYKRNEHKATSHHKRVLILVVMQQDHIPTTKHTTFRRRSTRKTYLAHTKVTQRTQAGIHFKAAHMPRRVGSTLLSCWHN
jgi:hypothetical protein